MKLCLEHLVKISQTTIELLAWDEKDGRRLDS